MIATTLQRPFKSAVVRHVCLSAQGDSDLSVSDQYRKRFFQVETRALLDVQLNSSDDNPGVAVGVAPHSTRAQESRGYTKGNGVTGAVLPGAVSEPLPSVLSFEETGLVLAHNSLASPNVSSS